jgi:multidrug efflux pump subunit AcrA (membrane-fusion protein)
MADDTRNPHDRDDERKLPAPEESTLGHQLPWPDESDPARLGDEFSDPNFRDDRKLAKSFADPNSLDDGRIGNSFAETSSSHKKKKPPIADRIHKPESRRVLYLSLIGFAIVFVLVLLVGWLIRQPDHKATEERAKEQRDAKPVVEVTKVQAAKDQAGLVVPGTTIPLTEAYVYARANGYLKKRFVDIGDHVKENQVLAIVDAPDLDAQVDQARQQVRQAEQQLEQQKSQLALATVTVQRYRVLVTKGVLSRQQGDQEEATYASSVANVAAAQRNVEAYEANLQHALALQSYEYVRSPFSGVITQRNVEVGALISAAGASSGAQAGPSPQGQNSSAGGSAQAGQSNNSGSSGSTSQSATSAQSPGQGGPLFAVAQNERLRILVSVPEGYSTAVHVGGRAQLNFQEYSGTQFEGDVTRMSYSIDANTRTMLTEIQVDNKEHKLIPGMYVVATFPPVPGVPAPILITGDAVSVRHDTSVVATVVDGKIHLVPIVIGRDFGGAIEILNGVRAGDVIVTNITDDVVDGAEVETQEVKSGEQKPAAPPPQNLPPGGSSMYGDQGITDRNLQGQQAQQNKKGSGAPQKKATDDSKSGSKP